MASTNSTIDGMGFEEINQAGDMPANMWITGSVVTDAGLQTAGDISGAGTLYALDTTIPTINTTTINGTVGSFTDINVADSMSVAGSIMANEYYGKVNDSDNFPINTLTYGSGTDFTGGASMLAGVGTLGAGSEDWIVFEDEPFDDAPSVLLTNSKSSALLWTGSISKGSGLVFGATASDTYSWLAIGL